MSGAALFWLIVGIVILVGSRYGLYRLFIKAGEEGWKAFVPVLSDIVWVKLIGRPIWWAFMCLIPAVRTLFKVQMEIDMAKAFGKYAFWEQALSVIAPYLYWPYIGHQEGDINQEKPRRGQPFIPKGTVYIGPPALQQNTPARGQIREWGDALLYAGASAVIIRSLFFEAFMIPTTSMEGTLKAGDFLFVSKYHYGARLPMIPLAIPLAFHNAINIDNRFIKFSMPSYLPFPELPYYRLPGLKKIERNDIVVFNYPANDIEDLGDGAGLVDQIAMKQNYVKRCVAIAGDKLEVRQGKLFVNDAPAVHHPHQQQNYYVAFESVPSPKKRTELGFRIWEPKVQDNNDDFQPVNGIPQFCDSQMLTSRMPIWHLSCSDDVLEKVKAIGGKHICPDIYPGEHIQPDIYPTYKGAFKSHQMLHNNRDNFGPLTIPKQGVPITLTPENYGLYLRLITVYEGHKLELKDKQIFIDGKVATSYTPAQNYYFMMGDNRHNSADSRYWGFVPEDHIIGTPVAIFMSYESDFGVRFNRIGTSKVK